MKRIKILMFCSCLMFAMCSINCDDSSSSSKPNLDYEQLEWLGQVGMKFYPGDTPPIIEGSYKLNSLTIQHDDLNLDHMVYDYTYSFNQQNGKNLLMSYAGPQAGDMATDLPVRIYGTENCFTVLANVEGSSSGCDYTMSQVVSGCLTPQGIANWQLGIVMGEKTGTNCDVMLNSNHRRVIKENDGLAERAQ